MMQQSDGYGRFPEMLNGRLCISIKIHMLCSYFDSIWIERLSISNATRK